MLCTNQDAAILSQTEAN